MAALKLSDFVLEVERLTQPDVLGFFESWELIEVFGIPNRGATPVNVFSIFIASERTAPSSISERILNPERIESKALKNWSFGIKEVRLPLSALAKELKSYDATGLWKPDGKLFSIGKLVPVPPRFVPADSTRLAPWNRVLKNNFWMGSYVLELADGEKAALRPLWQSEKALSDISDAVVAITPIRLASFSDRLGSVAVQVPVEVINATFSRTRPPAVETMSVDIAWHPKAESRSLQVTCESNDDNTITSFTSAATVTATVTLPSRASEGAESIRIWDNDNSVMLGGRAGTYYIERVGVGMRLLGGGKRKFTIPDDSGAPAQISVSVKELSKENLIGEPLAKHIEWKNKRIYKEEASEAARNLTFVQYRPDVHGGANEHQRALGNLRNLINKNAAGGAWLWDPYLMGSDILKTLCFCDIGGVPLRALTLGKEHNEPEGDKAEDVSEGEAEPSRTRRETFIANQAAVLDANVSEPDRLNLEYRISFGNKGWQFHDRFLIFPRPKEGALAWSLGTSLNHIGMQHHILQKVSDGQRVADAFEELWDQLVAVEHLVWKFPK